MRRMLTLPMVAALVVMPFAGLSAQTRSRSSQPRSRRAMHHVPSPFRIPAG